MFCKYCGQELNPNYAFCLQCGKKTKGKNWLAPALIFSILGLVALLIGFTAIAVTSAFDNAKDAQSLSALHQKTSSLAIFSLRDDDGNILMENGIKSAETILDTDANGRTSYVVEIQFTEDAAKKFGEITGEHIGEFIGIYLDEQPLAKPMITSAITGGACWITCASLEIADDLAEKLNATVE